MQDPPGENLTLYGQSTLAAAEYGFSDEDSYDDELFKNDENRCNGAFNREEHSFGIALPPKQYTNHSDNLKKQTKLQQQVVNSYDGGLLKNDENRCNGAFKREEHIVGIALPPKQYTNHSDHVKTQTKLQQQVAVSDATGSESETTSSEAAFPFVFIKCANNDEEFCNDGISGIYGVEDHLCKQNSDRLHQMELFNRRHHQQREEEEERDQSAIVLHASANSIRDDDDVDYKEQIFNSDGDGDTNIEECYSCFELRSPLSVVSSLPVTKAIPIANKQAAAASNLRSQQHFGIPCKAVPVMTSPNFSHMSPTLTKKQLAALCDQGFPLGLAQQIGKTKAQFPITFWVVDNSGSMRAPDGHQLRVTTKTTATHKGFAHSQKGRFLNTKSAKTFVATCTRWTELQGTIIDHAQLAGLLQSTTVFRMLNDPGVYAGNQECIVAGRFSKSTFVKEPANEYEEIQQVIRAMERTEPSGSTPLTTHLREFRRRIELIQYSLLQEGRKAVIVVATDGLPTDEQGCNTPEANRKFIETLRSLQRLPVWIVIRLCTDNETVVEYYNNIDKDLELQVDVVDDFLGEAEEVHRVNTWLNYAMPLHRCREMGFHHRIFDLLDERLLNKDELLEFLTVLFGEERFSSAPDIHTKWSKFSSFLSKIIKSEGKQWCAKTRKMEYWVDIQKLNKVYGTRKGFLWFFKPKKVEEEDSAIISKYANELEELKRRDQKIIDELKKQLNDQMSRQFSMQDSTETRSRSEAPGRHFQEIVPSRDPPEYQKVIQRNFKNDPPQHSLWDQVDYFHDREEYPPSINYFPNDGELEAEGKEEIISDDEYVEQTVLNDEAYIDSLDVGSSEDSSTGNGNIIVVENDDDEFTVYEELTVYEEETVYD